jgi:toxin ParE1/3/4
MRVFWLERAWQDRRSQLDYIAARNPAAARAMGDLLQAALHQIRDFPLSSPEGRIRGTRELRVSRCPWLIIYRLETDRLVILRLLHSSQEWP